MTATKELRAMLKERGVEWDANDTYRLLVTSWKDASGHNWAFMEHRDGNFSKLTAYHLTPEQAIAATLGCGECHPVEQYLDMHSDLTVTVCSSCGVPEDELADMNYCPNCGAKVVDE